MSILDHLTEKRYRFPITACNCVCKQTGLEESETGEWVRWEDHVDAIEAMRLELEALRAGHPPRELHDHLRKYEPVDNAAVPATMEYGKVDWGAVDRCEQVAPLWLHIPDLAARRRASSEAELLARILQDDPHYVPPRMGGLSYLLVYRNGEPGIGTGHPLHRHRQSLWVPSRMVALNYLSEELVAVYQAEDASHEKVRRVWAAHLRVFAACPASYQADWMEANTVLVTTKPPEEEE